MRNLHTADKGVVFVVGRVQLIPFLRPFRVIVAGVEAPVRKFPPHARGTALAAVRAIFLWKREFREGLHDVSVRACGEHGHGVRVEGSGNHFVYLFDIVNGQGSSVQQIQQSCAGIGASQLGLHGRFKGLCPCDLPEVEGNVQPIRILVLGAEQDVRYVFPRGDRYGVNVDAPASAVVIFPVFLDLIEGRMIIQTQSFQGAQGVFDKSGEKRPILRRIYQVVQ